MRWFSKITSREDALRTIRFCANCFYAFAVIQLLSESLLTELHELVGVTTLPVNLLLELALMGVFIGVLAFLLHYFSSRIAATILLLISVLSLGVTASNAGTSTAHGNQFFALVAALIAIRAMQATFKLHGSLATEHGPQEQKSYEPPKPRPAADFVNHPKAGVESTAATAAAAQSPKPYDREKWAALLKYDDEIAIVAGRISPLGQRWLDELAHAYLALNDKQYLRRIEEKIHADARAERARSRL